MHSKDLHNFNTSPNLIRVTESRRMRSAEHVERMGEVSNAYKILVGKLEGKERWEDLGVDGNIILEWILEKSSGLDLCG
jgi:hypothetical protein